MKKRYIKLILILTFILQNYITPMEKENYNQELNIIDMPNEMLLKIMQHVIEYYIFDWDNITDWYIIKETIIIDLKSIFLTCKHFEQFNNQDSINYIVNDIAKPLKLKI
ncbi:MAG: hypothetical protein M0R03_20215, partial [Novosphingobium sp.]|nr:hypothetical protein [Novosphingobium sp.]